MAAKLSLQTQKIIEYLERYHDKPILTIAKKLVKENPDLFVNVESARTKLRYYSGLSGKYSRKNVKKHLQRDLTYNYNPFDNIPESYQDKREFYQLPSTCTNIAVLSDIHFPYHDAEALKIAIDWIIENKCNCIYLNGDILDFYQLSDFLKDPHKPTMKKEIELGRWFLKSLRQTFPNIPIYYKIGNHEMRFERWMKVKGFEFLGMDEFKLSVLLGFAENHIIEIDKYTVAHAGDLRIIHGHEYRTSGGVQPARLLYLKTKSNVLAGHYHRISEYIDRNIDNKFHGGWSTGCLCELSPDYMPNNDWCHGFARVLVYPDKSFTVDNHKIINGKLH
jgi:predicted phosphodiesterase